MAELALDDNLTGGEITSASVGNIGEAAEKPHFPEENATSKPKDRRYAGLEKRVPFVKNDPRSNRSLTAIRSITARKVAKWLDWQKVNEILSALYETATNPQSRQQVAAANALFDRALGPVAQQVNLDVTQATESKAELAARILARLAELQAPPSIAPPEAIDARSEESPPAEA